VARTFKVTNGVDSVDLLDSSSPGIVATRGGFGVSKFIPHQLYSSKSIDEDLFIEHWDLYVSASSHDNAASQTRTLISLLKQAYLHRRFPVQFGPVWIEQQTTNETNARYAKIYESPEVSNPDFFDTTFDIANLIETQGVSIARFVWRSSAPNSLGSALVLDPTDGPASPTLVHVSNFRDDIDLTHIYVHDDGAGYGPNILTTSGSLFPSSPAVDDSCYIGSTDGPWKHAVINIGTAGDYEWNLAARYWNGGSWVDLVCGTDITYYPNGDEDELFKSTGDWVINIKPPSDWATISINSILAYWLRIFIVAITSTTTVPSKSSTTAYAQRTPEVRIPSTLIKGDTWPYLCMRMFTPAGGDENEGFANLSRILIGLKNDPGDFVSGLNAGNHDNPSGWATTYGDDSSAVADPGSPGGYHCAVSFSGEATMVKRVVFTGTGKLADWVGDYRAFIVCQQVGSGSAGDTAVMLRTYIHSNNTTDTKKDTPVVDLSGEDEGAEIVDLGTISIPFGQADSSDVYTGGNLIFEIHAERTTGTGTMEIYHLVLLPIQNDYGVTFEDPLTDSVNGTSALRGGNVLEDDGGVLRDRTIKKIVSGSYEYVGDEWGRGGPALRVEPETDTHLYFLMGHFPSGGTWGTGPFIATLGCALSFELYGHFCYLALRGSG